MTRAYPLPAEVLSGTLFTALDAAHVYHPHTSRVINERISPFYSFYLGDKSFSLVFFSFLSLLFFYSYSVYNRKRELLG